MSSISSIYLILPAKQGFTQSLIEMSTRSRKIIFMGRRARPACKDDNLTAFSELFRQCGISNISQPCRSPWPVMGPAIFFLHLLSSYAIYTTFKWTSHFLDNRYSSTEYNGCLFKHPFSTILNPAFSFIRLLRSDGRLIKIWSQHNMHFSESTRG
jgi:hypothetical protein